MIEILNVRMGLDETEETIRQRVYKRLRLLDGDVVSFQYAKKSIDARDKNDIYFNCNFFVKIKGDENSFLGLPNVLLISDDYLKELLPTGKTDMPRPVVVGAGPAGLFAALSLAKMGAKPILIERGQPVEQRDQDIEKFYATKILDPESNIQFGEGGAGTYSDGKLTTGKNSDLVHILLNEFVDAGAPEEIKYVAKPHLGTDNLQKIVKNIRAKIIALGGEVRFGTKLVGITMAGGALKNITVEKDGQRQNIVCSDVLLALGHSARDTFQMLFDSKLAIEQKPFSMGVRIEHEQEKINKAQYGKSANHPALRAADYKLACHLPNGRGVYTFCMCPGGYVIPSASELGGSVTNGMSLFARDGKYANAGLLVNVDIADFPSQHPLAGIEMQRIYEKKAFEASHGYGALVQTVGDFLKDMPTKEIKRLATDKAGVFPGEVKACLPDFVVKSLREALPEMDKHFKGFADAEALLYAVETRSSSPVRLVREADYQAVGFAGIYPCGEGSGYSGGITTSAMDGISSARALLKKYQK